MRERGVCGMKGWQLTRLDQVVGRLGLTPSDQPRVQAARSCDGPNEFDEFFPPAGRRF